MTGMMKQWVPLKTRMRLRMLMHRLNAMRYRGDQVECPLCEGKFDHFLAYGRRELRANAACPKCLSLERTRLLYLYLKNEFRISEKTGKVLHFAPEYGLERKLRQVPGLEYTTTDIDPAFAEIAADIQALPFADKSFDLIICSHVLAHVPDQAKAISELKRVCRPGGCCLILTLRSGEPITREAAADWDGATRIREFSEPDLERLHGDDFTNHLRSGGFSVEVLDYASKLSEEERNRYQTGDGLRERIWICRP